MIMYLILKCEPFNQYESDVDRTPIAIVSSWRTWYKEHKPNYSFEVWKYEHNNFTCIKDWD